MTEITNPFVTDEWVSSADNALQFHIHGVRGNRVAYTLFEWDADANEYWEVENRLGEWEDIPATIEEYEAEVHNAAQVEFLDNFRGPMQ